MKMIQTSHTAVGLKGAKIVITKFRIKGLRLRQPVKVSKKQRRG